MARYNKSNGKYHISGKTFSQLMGTRAQVWHGTAYKTSGGLTKNDLTQNKNGRIVSKSKHTSAKKEKRLIKHGFGTKKGKFGFVKMNSHSKTKRTRGGAPYGNSYSPAAVAAYRSNISNDVQFEAGNASGGSRKRRGGKGYGWLNGSNSLQFQAGNSSGGSRKRRGGKGYGWLNGSNSVQFQAGNASGGSRKRRGGKGYGWLNGSNGVQFQAGNASE